MCHLHGRPTCVWPLCPSADAEYMQSTLAQFTRAVRNGLIRATPRVGRVDPLPPHDRGRRHRFARRGYSGAIHRRLGLCLALSAEGAVVAEVGLAIARGGAVRKRLLGGVPARSRLLPRRGPAVHVTGGADGAADRLTVWPLTSSNPVDEADAATSRCPTCPACRRWPTRRRRRTLLVGGERGELRVVAAPGRERRMGRARPARRRPRRRRHRRELIR